MKLKNQNSNNISDIASIVDFLGWVNFTDHRILKTTTKRRMIKRITENPKPETISSYLGLMKHGNTFKIKEEIIRNIEKILFNKATCELPSGAKPDQAHN